MAAFFDRLYGHDGELTTAEWNEILTAIPRRQAEEESSLLVNAVRSAPWRGGREATLDALADELRLGRGMELARRVSDLRTAAEQQALVGTLVGSLLGRLLLDRGLATYQRTWAGPDVLRDGAGDVVDVVGLGNRAAGSADGVTAMLAFAEAHGIASSEVFGFGAEDGPGPLRILGCLAPLQSGSTTVVLAPCTRGLAVLRPRGLAEWLAVGQAPFVAGTARKLFDLLERPRPRGPGPAPARRGAALGRRRGRQAGRARRTSPPADDHHQRRQAAPLHRAPQHRRPRRPVGSVGRDPALPGRPVHAAAGCAPAPAQPVRGWESPDRRISDHDRDLARPGTGAVDERTPRRRRTGQAGAGRTRGHVGRALEGRRHLRVRPHPAAGERLLDRHPAADGQRVAARRARLLLHAHRPDRALPADAGQVGVLPDGLGRQRPAHRASRPELLRRALRPLAAVRPRLHAAGEARPEAPGPDQPPQLHRAVRGARREDEQVFEQLWRTLGLSVDWKQHYTTIGPKSQTRQPDARSCATSPAARPTSRRRRPSGTSRSRPRSRRPSSRPGSTPAPTTGSPTTGPTATPVWIETTRPELIASRGGADRAPRRRALPAPVRHHGHLPGLRGRGAGGGAPRRRDGQGRGHRDVLHVRRPDRRHLVARAPAAGAHGDRSRRPVHRETPAWLDAEPAAAAYAELAGKTVFSAREAMVAMLRESRRPRRRAEADPADGQLLREGRQAARDRLHPSVVHPQRRA